MDPRKLRKNCTDRKHSDLSDASPPPVQKPCNKKKGRHKGTAYQTNYSVCDVGFPPYGFNVLPQARIHPSSQRLFQTTDTSICHYPSFRFPLEHVSLPFYPTLLQAGTASATPLERVVRLNRTSEHEIPVMFQTFKQNSDIEQDYTSLPPANCNLNSKQPKDDSTSKRRFSDPGVAQVSSDECSGSRSSESSNSSSLQDLHMPYAYGLIEQVNELRENNSELTRELHEVKLELESLKLLSASWGPYSGNLQPGKLSESIVEVREAMKVNEEAMMTKMTNLFEKNSAFCNEVHRQLEERINDKIQERLGKLEEEIGRVSERLCKDVTTKDESAGTDDVTLASDVVLIQQQLVDSEREKLSLRKELQEAIDSRKEAEAHTLKLERLVHVLRKKINGVSVESCITDEKPATIRPLSSSFEQNPFIIANNKNQHHHHQQHQQQQQQKRSVGTKKTETENGIEGESIPPQVTITGPVADL